MADNTKDVKEFNERIKVPPSTDDELVGEEKETPAESSEAKKELDPAPDAEKNGEEADDTKKVVKPPTVDIKEVEGETPRERGLRLELTKLRRERAGEMSKDLLGPDKKPQTEPNTPAEDELAEFNPEEVKNLDKVIGVLAKRHGWVKKDEIQAQTYNTTAEDTLNNFLESHPEYTKDSDPEGVLWGQFRDEFKLYKQPDNPKELKRIFEKIHKEIFNIQPASGLNKIKAQKEKVNVASHKGASAGKGPSGARQQVAPTIRTDMLKGFSDEELTELSG